MNEPVNEPATGPALPTQASSLRAVVEAQRGAGLATDDVLFLALPLFRSVAQLHAHGRVAALGADDIVQVAGEGLSLRAADGRLPRLELEAIRRLQPPPGSTLNIVGELRVTQDAAHGARVENLQTQRDASQPIEHPVYLPGYTSWELVLGHHDEIGDIFQLGQVLASLACGLDFDDGDDLELFAAQRQNLFRINPRLNPVLAAIVVEMTALNRHERATDLASIVRRLETYRDQPVGLDVERVLSGAQGEVSRRVAVLSHLRDRLFDLSRRNRLLQFRPTQASVNLTIASVPIVLQLGSIRPEQLCTWSGEFADEVIAGKAVSLHRWLRFEDQPYLPGALDRIAQETRRDRAEYGFSHLRLVVAFLRWHNLKEDPEQRMVSPLLWLPVELVRKKGVRDQYVIQCEDGEAEFNPALRHYLRQLYDIRLPETVDLQKVSLESIHADLAAQIRASEPGVELRLQRKPAIELIRRKAVQRLQQYQRRSGGRARSDGPRPDFSYERDDYRPLGLALFRQHVQPSPLPLRGAVGAAPTPSPLHMSASADEVEHTTYALQDDNGHAYAWDFDLTQVTLANFNYRKMSLVRDYAQLIEEGAANPAFDKVFSIEPREVDVAAPPPIAPAEQWNVIASDATQTAAVALARGGRSFIIQGPPGTGKSQTITNLIADYAGRGQRVLFVCEKRAALDVVFHRLKQAGLDELCCLIHDSQTDKKAFVQNLREGYERWVAQPHQHERLSQSRASSLDELAGQLGRIEGFERGMAQMPERLACSVRSLLRRSIELPPMQAEIGAAEREHLPDYAVWERNRESGERLRALLQERFGLDRLAGHPFARLSAGLLGDERAYAQTVACLDECEPLLDRLDAAFEDGNSLLNPQRGLADAVQASSMARRLRDARLAAHPDLLDAGSTASAQLRRERDELDGLDRRRAEAGQGTVHWRAPFSVQDTEAALAAARRDEASLLRWLKPSWWRLRGVLSRSYDFAQHAMRPSYTQVLEAKAAHHQADAAYAQAEERLRARLDTPAAAACLATLDQWTSASAASPVLRELLERLRAAPDPLAHAAREAEYADPLLRLQQIVESRLDMPKTVSLGELAEWTRDLRESLDDLPDFLPSLRAIHQAGPAYAHALQQLDLPASQLEALVADEALARLYREQPELARFDGRTLADAAQRVARAERQLLERNASVVRATLHRSFLEHVRQSSLSASQLDSDGKLFKKRYATGRRELEHEFGKSMRYRSIRELAGGDTGLVVNDLKPIWLMSPLSVSDTLPLAADLFDVVIFDEASQIPTEEAVPALSRARQAVVVGDEMQLPPTSFFSAAGDEDDMQVVAEEDGERIAINLDADSLLNQAARNLPATLLAWHYRSRHEALISFSNAAFYDGRLITIPDRRLDARVDESLSVRAAEAQAAAAGVDALLARPISHHRVEDGVYANRCNLAEARYIAGLVRELLRRETGLSLGVVAFSEAQQGEIESALEALAAEDADFAMRLEREYLREDDDQFCGLFVKNLENVQGDERDLILLSICYAPGADGRMLMNFGPINQRGGEKRLNVIFSRAKHRMAVVTTIRADAITNTHNDGAAALRAFLQFAEASARGESERSQTVLGALNPGAERAFASAPKRDAFRAALLRALRERGHVVHEHVGRSQFRCDLGIVDPSGEGYALAILLDAPDVDGEAVSVEVRERYVFRPGILRAFGWRVIDLPSSEWLRNPQAVLERIEASMQADQDAAEEAVTDEGAAADGTTGSVETVSMPTDAAAPDPASSPSTAAPTLREFLLQQGSSNKFWRIGQHDGEMTVVFGRVGTRGQTLIKQFDTPERAEREVIKLIEEKLRKGYTEAAPG
ncbi:WGR domain protein [Lysobacter antibioticus]|uniref:AAA domain-containing protein n=1 Tax=Lysobacter antibioticus TaxID=84531 RepID=UPI000716F783|nr:AAA domain-containing protein [Lysobacter antibioticus]ALN63358.1 WGR domain protein [Lysobacter antibioticus]